MTAPLDTDVLIETPEHIEFHYRIAGPARRAAAYVIDLLVCYGVLFIVAVIVLMGLGISFGKSGIEAAAGLFLVLLFAAQWVYFVVWEAITGRSPGKRALGLRVLTTTGRPIGFQAAALRNLLRAADFLPTAYLVGVVSMALSSKFQRLGDLVAATIVVVPESTYAATALELRPPAQPKELAKLPDDISLDADERAAIELFLRRRHTLGVAREHELAGMIAEIIGDRVGYAHKDPSRLLALVYDRAVNAGRTEAPPSSFRPAKRKKPKEKRAWR